MLRRTNILFHVTSNLNKQVSSQFGKTGGWHVRYLFYGMDCTSNNSDSALKGGYSFEIWRPSFVSAFPRCLIGCCSISLLLLWWIMHHLFSIHGRHTIFIVLHEGRPVHYTVVLPKSFRFSFMGNADLQLGPSWTHPSHRRKGLLRSTVDSIRIHYRTSHCRLWWICRENNFTSNTAARRLGFTAQATGRKKRILCISIFVQQERIAKE